MTTSFPITGTTDNKYAVGTVINTDGSIAKTDASGKATSSATLDKDSFMKLLVAQLKYQTPDSPADSSQFMAQTAQFSMLEAIQNMAKGQSSLLVAQQSVTATGMLGQRITAAPSNGTTDIVGVVTGVKLGTDGPVLKIGDMEVPLSSVKEVTKP